MNGLKSKEQSITSIEVAEMVEKAHSKILRDIRQYSAHLAEAKIGLGDFWSESTYTDAKGESRPCYLVTKKGCEFIAHKMVGAKGTVFTARYINRFHDMENAIQSGQLELQTRTQTAIPTQSGTPVPKRPDWYNRNRKRILNICEKRNITHKEIYHFILSALSEKYDIKGANEIYRREKGYSPEYQMDIVGYFPELAREADKMLDWLEMK